MSKAKKNMYLRIKESEKDMLREVHMKINNELLKNGYQTISDSEILHTVIKLSLKKLQVDKLGRFYIET